MCGRTERVWLCAPTSGHKPSFAAIWTFAAICKLYLEQRLRMGGRCQCCAKALAVRSSRAAKAQAELGDRSHKAFAPFSPDLLICVCICNGRGISQKGLNFPLNFDQATTLTGYPPKHTDFGLAMRRGPRTGKETRRHIRLIGLT